MNALNRAIALGLLLLLPLGTAGAAPPRPTTPEDITRLAYVDGAVISHRGDRVAFVVTRLDAAHDRYRRNIWVVGVRGGEPHQLTRGDGDTDPQWSPDDRVIAFTGARGADPATSQIYRIALDGGEARRLTDETYGASSPRWSHDGTRLLYTATFIDPPHTTRFDERAAGIKLDAKHRTSDIRVIDRLDFEDNGSGEIYDKHVHLLLIDARGGGRRMLTPLSPWSETSPVWSYDDRNVAVVSLRRPVDPERVDSDVYVVSAHGGTLRRVTRVHRGNAAPVWSHDSRTLFVAVQSRFDPAAMNGIDAILPSGREQRVVAENVVQFGDQMLTDTKEGGAGCGPLLEPHDRWFLAEITVPGATALQRFDAASGKASSLVARGDEIADCSMNDAATQIAYTADDVTHPAEVFVYDIARGISRRLTHFNAAYVAQTRLAPAQPFVVRDEAGSAVQAWFIPADVPPGTHAPTLLEIHGGPGLLFGNAFFHEFQLLAGRGYNVVYANPRGSLGYGYAFSAALSKNWGDPMFRDETAVVDAVAKRADVDSHRIGVLGGSYGGYATLWMIGHTHRFKAAVAERVVSNMTSSYLACDECYSNSEVTSFGNAWAHQPVYWRMSPIASIASVTTPLLLLHSDEDTRTPLVDSDQWFTLAKSLGETISYVQVPRDNHDLNRTGEPVHRIERLRLIVDWFAKEL